MDNSPIQDADTSPPLRILVVDDNEGVAKAMARMLKVLGYETRIVFSGDEALQMGAEFLPQVVLLDLCMPGLDGFETARRMRAQSWGKYLVLAALSGSSHDGDKQHSREAGIDVHLVKPVQPEVLQSLLAGTMTALE